MNCICAWYFLTKIPLQLRHNGRDGVSNHQPHDCLLNRLFGRGSKKTSKLRVIGLCAGNSPMTGDSPHKWPVTRKMFPFDDVIMHHINSKILSIIPIRHSRWLIRAWDVNRLSYFAHKRKTWDANLFKRCRRCGQLEVVWITESLRSKPVTRYLDKT